MARPKLKVLLLFANYGPYHIARLEGCFHLSEAFHWQIIPVELTRAGIAYEWKAEIDYNRIPILSVLGDKLPSQVLYSHLLNNLYSTLQQLQPDVMAIAGYSRPAMLAALVWGLYHNVPAILLSESKEDDSHRNWLVEKLKARIVRTYRATLVGGQPQKRYLMKLGVPEKAVALGYNVVGNDSFDPDKIRTLPRPLARPYFLTINRFIPKKNLPLVIDAYAAYRQIAGKAAWDLVLCGSGELLTQLNQQIHTLGLDSRIHRPGFLQQDELLPYLAHAGCFIHASTHEQWGLVVNEAMAAGLPVLVSHRCGCFEDLVVEGINGFGFDPYNCDELTDLLLKITSSSVDRVQMGEAALRHIQAFSPDYFASGLKQAIDYAIAH